MSKFFVTLSLLLSLAGCGRNENSEAAPKGLWNLDDHRCDIKRTEASHEAAVRFEKYVKAHLQTTQWGTPAHAQTVVTVSDVRSTNAVPALQECRDFFVAEVRVGGPFVFTNIYELRAQIKGRALVDVEKFLVGVTSN